jgi:hypothetical protein
LAFFGFVGGVRVVAVRLGIIRLFGSWVELWGFGGMKIRKGVEVVVLWLTFRVKKVEGVVVFLEAGAVGEGIMLDSSNQRVWEEGWAAKRRKRKAEKRRKQNTYSSSCSEDECCECDQCNSVGQPIHVYKPFPIWDLVWMSATASRWYGWLLFPPYLSTFLNLHRILKL